MNLFDRPSDAHNSGLELVMENYPAYLGALESNRSIVAPDATEDPRTAELGEYLEEHDVRALLNSTIRSEGDVVGVVCHEHVGSPRDWTDDDSIQPRDIVPVSATNCEIVASTEQTNVLENVERDAPEETDRAGFTDWDISCYIGAPVFADDGVYGTFCFYHTEPRADQFSD